jgi:hypothetical protein
VATEITLPASIPAWAAGVEQDEDLDFGEPNSDILPPNPGLAWHGENPERLMVALARAGGSPEPAPPFIATPASGSLASGVAKDRTVHIQVPNVGVACATGDFVAVSADGRTAQASGARAWAMTLMPSKGIATAVFMKDGQPVVQVAHSRTPVALGGASRATRLARPPTTIQDQRLKGKASASKSSSSTSSVVLVPGTPGSLPPPARKKTRNSRPRYADSLFSDNEFSGNSSPPPSSPPPSSQATAPPSSQLTSASGHIHGRTNTVVSDDTRFSHVSSPPLSTKKVYRARHTRKRSSTIVSEDSNISDTSSPASTIVSTRSSVSASAVSVFKPKNPRPSHPRDRVSLMQPPALPSLPPLATVKPHVFFDTTTGCKQFSCPILALLTPVTVADVEESGVTLARLLATSFSTIATHIMDIVIAAGPGFLDIVRMFIIMEYHGFSGKQKGLPACRGVRPALLDEFLKSHRKLRQGVWDEYTPRIFGDKTWEYWGMLQSEERENDLDNRPGPITDSLPDSSWDCLRQSGRNGLGMIVLALVVWFIRLPDEKRSERKSWARFVMEVRSVFRILTDGFDDAVVYPCLPPPPPGEPSEDDDVAPIQRQPNVYASSTKRRRMSSSTSTTLSASTSQATTTASSSSATRATRSASKKSASIPSQSRQVKALPQAVVPTPARRSK